MFGSQIFTFHTTLFSFPSCTKMSSSFSHVSTFIIFYHATIAACQSSIASISPQSSSSLLSSSVDNVTLITTTSGSSTWVETFTGTSLSQFSTLTTPTSVTITNAAGAVLAGVALAGGLAWLGVAPAGAPVVDAPTTPPELTAESTEEPPSTSSSAITGTPMLFLVPSDWPINNLAQIPVFQDDGIHCGFPNDDPASVNATFAQEKLIQFCNDKNNQSVTSDDATGEDWFISSGMLLNITVSLDPACNGDTSETLDPNDCQYFLNQTISQCDAKSDTKFGGTVDNGCFNYVLHPQNNMGDLTCSSSTNGTGVNRDEIMAGIATFCSQNEGKTVSPGNDISTTIRMEQGDSSAIITVTYEVTDFCPNGPTVGYTIDENACSRFLNRTVDDCNTNFKPPYGKYGGTVIDNCGVFQLQTNVTETVQCSDAQLCVSRTGSTPHNITLTDGQKALADYCGLKLTLDPSAPSPASAFSQTVPTGQSYDYYYKGLNGYFIKMQASFGPQDGCLSERKFSTQGQECTRKMTKIIDTCKSISSTRT